MSGGTVEERPRRTALFIALSLACAVFVPFAISAFLFVRMPPLGTPIAELGWTPARIATPEFVVVEADGAHAWIVSLDAEGGTSLSACRVELASGQGVCRKMMTLDAKEQVASMHHAVGKRGVIVVVETRGEGQQPVFRFAVASIDGPSSSDARMLTLPWPTSPPERATVIDVVPSEEDGFEIVAAPDADDRIRGARIFVSGEGRTAGDWRLQEALANGVFGHPLSITRGWPTAFVMPDPLVTLKLVDTSGRTELVTELPACTYGFCVQVASSAHYQLSGDQVQAWLDSSGRITPTRGMPHSPDGASPTDRFYLVETLKTDGRSLPLFMRQHTGSADAGPTPPMELALPAGRELVLRPQRRGEEQVLLVGEPRGDQLRIARAHYSLSSFSPVPSATGLLLLDAERVVVLDSDLRRTDGMTRARSVRDTMAKRFRLDPLSTSIYVLLVLLFPVLAVRGLIALRRKAPQTTYLKAALWSYVALGAFVLLQNYRYIFPP